MSEPTYPVELQRLELEPYRRGNTGIDFVHLRDSGRPGPHAMVNALTHGNEPAGALAVARLIDMDFRPSRGRLTLSFANAAAHAAFSPERPETSRFLDRDLNRLWRDDWIDADGTSREAARARELRPHLATVDLLLDLHTTWHVPRPFLVLADLAKTRALADAMAWPPTQQLMPGGCGEGRHLIDYGRFADPNHAATAVAVECGRHFAARSVTNARRTTWRFFAVAGMLPPEAERPAAAGGELEPAAALERFCVVESYIARTGRLWLTVPYGGFGPVRAGQQVGWDGEEAIVAPLDGVILSPRPRPRPGDVAFNWGRLVG
ncbi:MAG TPA: succinylglutamate desuccinylase/aspartoacylase family protein [Geminicoccaceae bacterium]|nr:succinylglutamate desuccinylase/aspartoacylase family protein [Geminicoccaceae bacterium]